MTDEPAGKWREKMGVGFCYRQGDVGDLAAKIGEFLSEPEKLRQRGESARRAVLEHFSYDRIAQRAEELMGEAMAEFSPQNSPKAQTLG